MPSMTARVEIETANKDSASIQNFEVKLPQTALKIDRANVDLTQVDSIGQLVDNAKLTLRIAPSEVCLKDLASFVPAFQNFAERACRRNICGNG